MFSLRSRQITHPLNVIVAAVVVAGCGGGSASSTVTSTPSTTRTPPATTAPSETVATPSSGLTLQETTWLAGVAALAKKMLGPTADKTITITSKYLREEAKRLGSCGAELAQLGPATDRLQPVLVLAQQACAKYGETAKCFTAAKSNIDQASKCLDAFNQATQLFGIAESTADSLKDAVN